MKNIKRYPLYLKESSETPEELGMALHSILHNTPSKVLLREVSKLIEAGADLSLRDEFKLTPLHDAVYHYWPEVIKLLLDNGAEIDATDKDGGTPLHSACYLGYPVPVRILLDYGADPNLRKETGLTPLMAAVDGGFSIDNTLEVAEMLIEAGAEINSQDLEGETPLHYAAYGGWPKIITFLIERGAKLDEKNTSGETPLITTVKNRDRKSAQALLSAGADPTKAFETLYDMDDFFGKMGMEWYTLTPEIERRFKAKAIRKKLF